MLFIPPGWLLYYLLKFSIQNTLCYGDAACGSLRTAGASALIAGSGGGDADRLTSNGGLGHLR